MLRDSMYTAFLSLLFTLERVARRLHSGNIVGDGLEERQVVFLDAFAVDLQRFPNARSPLVVHI